MHIVYNIYFEHIWENARYVHFVRNGVQQFFKHTHFLVSKMVYETTHLDTSRILLCIPNKAYCSYESIMNQFVASKRQICH